MPLNRTPPKGRVGTRSNPGELTDLEMEKLKQDLERASLQAAEAQSENEQLRKQLNKLIQLNETLLAERDELQRPVIIRDSMGNVQSNVASDINTANRNNAIVSSDNDNARNGLNDELVRGILNHFQSLQIIIDLPNYNGDKGNPAEFIERLEKYFVRKKIANNQKLNVTEDAVKGRARAWFEARPNSFINYGHFRSSFLQEFYSLEARAEIKNSWTTRKFKHSDGSLTEYYTEQRRIAKHISPPMDMYEINYHIINQLPPRVREVLSVID